MSTEKIIKGKLFINELNITNLISGTSVNNLGIDSSGNVIIGSVGGSGSTSDSYWLSGGTGLTAITTNTVYSPKLETTDDGEGIIMRSPNGTRYKITVDNSGALVSTAV